MTMYNIQQIGWVLSVAFEVFRLRITYYFYHFPTPKQIGLKSAKYLLTSTASLEYDRNQYIFFSSGSNNNPPIHKVMTHYFHLFVF